MWVPPGMENITGFAVLQFGVSVIPLAVSSDGFPHTSKVSTEVWDLAPTQHSMQN